MICTSAKYVFTLLTYSSGTSEEKKKGRNSKFLPVLLWDPRVWLFSCHRISVSFWTKVSILGKQWSRKMWRESEDQQHGGSWNLQRNMTSEKSSGVLWCKGLLECPMCSSKLFVFLQLKSPLLLKTSVASTAQKYLGWFWEKSRWRGDFDLGLANRKGKKRVTEHEMGMSTGVMEAGTMSQKWSWEWEIQNTNRNRGEINGTTLKNMGFGTWATFTSIFKEE